MTTHSTPKASAQGVANRNGLPLWDENPFSARRVRPGTIPFIFPPGSDLETLLGALRSHAWRGAIVGPHGSGKSTLLSMLTPRLERDGKRVTAFALHDGQRRMPSGYDRQVAGGKDRLLIVDGYEQLSWWSRRKLLRRCSRAGWGLLVTSHGPTGLPELFRTRVDHPLAEEVVARLQGDLPGGVSRADVHDAFARHGGDLREMLFDLYDRYERRGAERPTSTDCRNLREMNSERTA